MKRRKWRTPIYKSLMGMIGLVMLIIGIGFIIMQFVDDKKYDKQVTAVVRSVDKRYDSDDDEYEYKASCDYVVRDKTYRYVTAWSDHKYKENEEITIKVNSDNPEKVNRHVYMSFGLVLLLIGVTFIYYYISRSRI